VLRLIELQKRFGDTVVVDRLSLDVARGERVVLLGGSGSGKTTTLKMVNRLIEPDAGRIEIDGVDAATLAPHELRRSIGYCFQQVGLFPHLTVPRTSASRRVCSVGPRIASRAASTSS
jgi:osmoprotectant transport system ATP-binding protein